MSPSQLLPMALTSAIVTKREMDCTGVGPDCPVSDSFYGYAPSTPPNAILLALFGLALIAHTAQGFYYRAWGSLITFGLGCICEVIGKPRTNCCHLRR